MKPRDGIWIANGLQADFRLIRTGPAGDDVCRVETAAGENWAHGTELHWEGETKEEAEHEEVFEALCEEIAELHTEIDDLNKDRASRCACRFDLDSIPAAKVEDSRFMHGGSICAYHQHREALHAKEIAEQLEEVKEWKEWYANGGKP